MQGQMYYQSHPFGRHHFLILRLPIFLLFAIYTPTIDLTSKLEAICSHDCVAERSEVPDFQWVVKSPGSNPGTGCMIIIIDNILI